MKELRLGVTGARSGLNDVQRTGISGWLDKPFWGRDYLLREFHHGDCVGADVEVAELVARFHPKCLIICHPPVKTQLRGYFESDVVKPTKGYFARNRDIVNDSDMLVGFPAHRSKGKGGTWYTINYAVKKGVKTGIYHADGEKEYIT